MQQYIFRFRSVTPRCSQTVLNRASIDPFADSTDRQARENQVHRAVEEHGWEFEAAVEEHGWAFEDTVAAPPRPLEQQRLLEVSITESF